MARRVLLTLGCLFLAAALGGRRGGGMFTKGTFKMAVEGNRAGSGEELGEAPQDHDVDISEVQELGEAVDSYSHDSYGPASAGVDSYGPASAGVDSYGPASATPNPPPTHCGNAADETRCNTCTGCGYSMAGGMCEVCTEISAEPDCTRSGQCTWNAGSSMCEINPNPANAGQSCDDSGGASGDGSAANSTADGSAANSTADAAHGHGAADGASAASGTAAAADGAVVPAPPGGAAVPASPDGAVVPAPAPASTDGAANAAPAATPASTPASTPAGSTEEGSLKDHPCYKNYLFKRRATRHSSCSATEGAPGSSMGASEHFCNYEFNSDQFGEEQPAFDESDVETFISRIYPKADSTLTCGFRLKTPDGFRTAKMKDPTMEECTVVMSPTWGMQTNGKYEAAHFYNDVKAFVWPYEYESAEGQAKVKDFTLKSDTLKSVKCLAIKIPKDILAEKEADPNQSPAEGDPAKMAIMNGLLVRYRIMKMVVCTNKKDMAAAAAEASGAGTRKLLQSSTGSGESEDADEKKEESSCAVRKYAYECYAEAVQKRECTEDERALVAMRG